MPEYTYECDIESGGCGNVFSVLQSISKYKVLKRCPECKKHKLVRSFETDNVSGSVAKLTLGNLAEKNSSSLSNDEKSHLKKRHNAYRDSEGAELPEGMSRIEKKEKPWYKKKSDNISKLRGATPEQQAKYINTGKIK